MLVHAVALTCFELVRPNGISPTDIGCLLAGPHTVGALLRWSLGPCAYGLVVGFPTLAEHGSSGHWDRAVAVWWWGDVWASGLDVLNQALGLDAGLGLAVFCARASVARLAILDAAVVLYLVGSDFILVSGCLRGVIVVWHDEPVDVPAGPGRQGAPPLSLLFSLLCFAEGRGGVVPPPVCSFCLFK